MIKINKRYLENKKIRNNTTTRAEVLAIDFVDGIIEPNDNWNVGAETSFNLPDIYNDNKTLGFEVVRCESEIDFRRDDIMKELENINYDYSKYLKIKANNKDHIFNNKEFIFSIFDNKIISTSTKGFGHSIDWMINYYKKTIKCKLHKLNKGNYSECQKVSLIILSTYRVNDYIGAQQIQEIYSQQTHCFEKSFDVVYYITSSAIYFIKDKEASLFKQFNDNEFSKYVKQMKQKLKIDEYQ